MKRSALIFVGCCVVSPLAFGQSTGDAATGKKLAWDSGCTLCHGPDGNGNKGNARFRLGDIPRISAQPKAYFIKSMMDFKRGKRVDNDMGELAERLSDKQIRELAEWYGSQTPRAVATYDYDPER